MSGCGFGRICPTPPPTLKPVAAPPSTSGCGFGQICPTPPPTLQPVAAPPTTLAPTRTVASTDAKPPSPRPTPLFPFRYSENGDSSFGYRWQDMYSQAHQHAFRRPGWSHFELLSGFGPFCYRDICYNVTEVCNFFGGTLLHSSVCSFTEDVKIAGPSCWQGTCKNNDNGKQVCDAVGGITIGVSDGTTGPQWCIFSGAYSLIGPMCWGSNCFPDETKAACNSMNGGRVWNDDYCIVDGYYTVLGPFCWGSLCFAGDGKSKCQDLGGTLFAGSWCLLPGCDKTVIGPTCSSAPVIVTDQCFPDASREVCARLKGTDVAGRFCVIDGVDWTLIGPTAYERFEATGPTNDFARQLRHNLAGYFNNMETYEIAGRFVLVKGRLPTTSPICTDDGCDTAAGNAFCNRFKGKTLAQGFMCALCDGYRQVVGPMMWNGTLLEGDPQYCEGMFCAVPLRKSDLGTNARCPQSDPITSRCTDAVCSGDDCARAYSADDNVTESNGGDGENGGDGIQGLSGQTSASARSGRVSGLIVTFSLMILSHLIYRYVSY